MKGLRPQCFSYSKGGMASVLWVQQRGCGLYALGTVKEVWSLCFGYSEGGRCDSVSVKEAWP